MVLFSPQSVSVMLSESESTSHNVRLKRDEQGLIYFTMEAQGIKTLPTLHFTLLEH